MTRTPDELHAELTEAYEERRRQRMTLERVGALSLVGLFAIPWIVLSLAGLNAALAVFAILLFGLLTEGRRRFREQRTLMRFIDERIGDLEWEAANAPRPDRADGPPRF